MNPEKTSTAADGTTVAAGGLVWRHCPDGPRLAVVHQSQDDQWALPQGILAGGEDPVAAAPREVLRDTGWHAEIGDFAGSLWQAVDGVRKLVLFWQMTARTGRFVPNDQVIDLAWLTAAEAEARLARPGERELVARSAPPAKAPGAIEASPSYWRLLIGGSSRAASQRLTASVENFEADLEYRLDRQPGLRGSTWEEAFRTQLETVRQYHRRGEIDTAWRCFTAAARRELDKAGEPELVTRANALRREAAAGKLSSAWRSATIADLLEAEKIERQLPDGIEDVRWLISEATRLRDEDADNRYYKVALVRGQRSLLLVGLVASILILLGLAAAVDWAGDLGDPSAGFVALVAVFGALGASMSAIQSLGRAGAGGRIPEHVASSLITITRPALGAAAGVGVYAIAASGLLNINLEGEEAHLTVLALAFASGFSERLVMSAVGAATGSVQQTEKR